MQVDVCGLDFIKYDFVGRFENMDSDVAHVLKRLGRPRGSAFELGKNAHPTAASARLAAMYSEVGLKHGWHQSAVPSSAAHVNC